MKTMFEVEARTDDILARISDIFTELKIASNSSPKTAALTEELEELLREYARIFVSLQNIQEIAERLHNERCSGPH